MNDFAVLLERVHYDNFQELSAGLETFHSELTASVSLSMGKSDFKSAFKTLPILEAHQWLCWALVWDPLERIHKAVPLFSHVFGNIGGVTAWFRAAKAIQHIMLKLFGIYVLGNIHLENDNNTNRRMTLII